jgi:hypothetical protein
VWPYGPHLDSIQKQALQTDVSNSRAVKDATVNKCVKDVLYFTPNFSLTKSIAMECGLHKFYQVCISIIDRLQRIGGLQKEEFILLKALILSNSLTINSHSPENQGAGNEANMNEQITLMDKKRDLREKTENLRASLLSSLSDCIAVTRRCQNSTKNSQTRSQTPEVYNQNLLLVLPDIRSSDVVMRQFWLDVHNSKWDLNNPNSISHSISGGPIAMMNVPMKTLFIEMLEAGVEWYEEENTTI